MQTTFAQKAKTRVLRSANDVMRLERMGCAHQSRLSFMRQLLRRASNEQWQFQRTQWQINSNGVGHAVYQVYTGERYYSLLAFSHDLLPEQRSDRVIATAWDATFTLFDGKPSTEDISRLKANVPLQEAGRISVSELTLSRANRSGRLFTHVVDCLSQGQQPELERVEATGYLMRTTAVYGSGKFGAADYELIQNRAEFQSPFQVELLTVYLIRLFSIDIVEHLACVTSHQAVALSPQIRRILGIGNSTGLGMAPYLINHPQLLHNWINAREQALRNVRCIQKASESEVATFKALLKRTLYNNTLWYSEHAIQKQKIEQLSSDGQRFLSYIKHLDFSQDYVWDNIYHYCADNLSMEAQEQLNMLMLEPYAERVDHFGESMSADNQCQLFAKSLIQGTVESMIAQIETYCDWALDDTADSEQYWYVSENKLEPRFGKHIHDEIAVLPLNIKQQINTFHQQLLRVDTSLLLAEFLLLRPQFRFIAQRIARVPLSPYREVRDNVASSHTMPIDLLRLKLSFFGATKFDPRSDRWVRINMFQYAPFPHELDQSNDDWVFPELQ